MRGRVVKTLSRASSSTASPVLGLEVVTTPVGFKWIYEEMVAGDVLVGGRSPARHSASRLTCPSATASHGAAARGDDG
jgi:phosphoglucomutase